MREGRWFMGNIMKVSSIDTNLNDTQDKLMPQKKETERAKEKKISNFSDIYEIRLLSSEFNRASLESKRENLASICSQMQTIMQDIRFSGVRVIKDITYSQQLQARLLLES